MSDYNLMCGLVPSGDPPPEALEAHGLAGAEYNNTGAPGLPLGWNRLQHSSGHEGMYRYGTRPQHSIYQWPLGGELLAGQANLATGQGVDSMPPQSIGFTRHNPGDYHQRDPELPVFDTTLGLSISGRSEVLFQPSHHLNLGQGSRAQMDRIDQCHISSEPLNDPLWDNGGIDPTDATALSCTARGEMPMSTIAENPRVLCEIRDSRSRNGPQKKKKPRAKGVDWEDWKKYLEDLHLAKGHTVVEIVFEMGTIHQFHASLSTYQKRFKKWSKCRKDENTTAQSEENPTEPYHPGAPRRRHAAVLPQSVVSSVLFHLILRRQSEECPIPSITEEPYVHQHRMFHALDGLVKALFAARTNPWTCNSFTFLPPDGEPENSSSWRLLSAKCSGMATVSTAMVGPVTGLLFKQVLCGLDAVTRSRDPNFLVHFWKICLDLSGIRLRIRGRSQEFIFVRAFLRYLRYMFMRYPRTRGDLLVVIDSLTQILERSPRDLRTSLVLGCWKVTHVLGDMIGANHTIVMGLGVYCTKQRNTKFAVDQESLAPQYERLLEQTAAHCSPSPPDLRISVLYDYTYALMQGKYNSSATKERATYLWNLSADVCRRRVALGSLRYTLATRAFAFAADVLAVHELETWKRGSEEHYHCREASFGFMDQAIEILKHGDLECQVTAAHFSKRLALWFKSYCPGPKVDPERLRAAQKAAQGQKCRLAGRIKGERSLAEKRRTAEILANISHMSTCAIGGSLGNPCKDMSKKNRWRRKKKERRDLVVAQVVTEGQSDCPLTRGG